MSTSLGPTLGSLLDIPPPESQFSDLARALIEVNRKPRNRSEWEARFSFWQKPASETEETKLAAAATRIRRAMRHSRDLDQRSWTIVEQGSYHNNTNTRTESEFPSDRQHSLIAHGFLYLTPSSMTKMPASNIGTAAA